MSSTPAHERLAGPVSAWLPPPRKDTFGDLTLTAVDSKEVVRLLDPSRPASVRTPHGDNVSMDGIPVKLGTCTFAGVCGCRCLEP